MSTRRPRGRPIHDDVLTPAEWRVVHAAKHGMTNREIARRQGVSLDAVKFHIANAISKLGLPNKKALKQWFQVPKESALRKQEKPMNKKSSLGPIGQISRTVSDIKKAEAWYKDILGLPHLYTFGNLAFFDCNGTRLFLSEEENGAKSESVLYLMVDDIQATHEQMSGRGIEFINKPHMIHKHEDGTEEWMAFFNDPDERPLAIMSQVNT